MGASTSYVYVDRRPVTPPLEGPINRQALGRIAKLGDLYDATTDNFCKVSVFKQPLPPDSPAISTTNCPHTETRFSNVSSMEEKFLELNVTGELQLSVLTGMCQPTGGYAEYLRQKKTNVFTMISTQLCHTETVTERLEVLHEEVKNNISEKAMCYPGATHVVIEILWGANCLITARQQRHAIEKRRRTGTGFVTSMSNIPILGRLSVGRKRNKTEEETETSVEISGDVFPNMLPTKLGDAQKIMENIPEMIKNCNDGKGRPLTYVMIPIPRLRSFVDIRTFISVDDARTMKIVRQFDEMTDLRQKVRDQILILSKDENRLDNYEAQAKTELSQLLMTVRSGQEAVGCLDDFYANYFNSYHEVLMSFLRTPGVPTPSVPLHPNGINANFLV